RRRTFQFRQIQLKNCQVGQWIIANQGRGDLLLVRQRAFEFLTLRSDMEVSDDMPFLGDNCSASDGLALVLLAVEVAYCDYVDVHQRGKYLVPGQFDQATKVFTKLFGFGDVRRRPFLGESHTRTGKQDEAG